MRRAPSVQAMIEGIRAGQRAMLGRAITLIESRHPEHQRRAQELLRALLPRTGAARRIGITGVPGAGKSTLIERLGTSLTSKGHRVAVLAIDPSSSLSGGSILGDKTRMTELARDPNAFVRPSPTSGSLGGVARRTREVMLLCEAAGYDIVLIETVGVGQSETLVAEMVDTFVVVLIAGAGDELQGIKRGLVEVADILTINKADGDGVQAARMAALEYRRALRYLRSTTRSWTPKVLTCSARSGEGLDELWASVGRHREALEETGEFDARRRKQQLGWMWRMVEDQLLTSLRQHPGVREMLPECEAEVLAGTLPPSLAARRLIQAFSGP